MFTLASDALRVKDNDPFPPTDFGFRSRQRPSSPRILSWLVTAGRASVPLPHKWARRGGCVSRMWGQLRAAQQEELPVCLHTHQTKQKLPTQEMGQTAPSDL
jgi:hypothetical protein